jgi:hypothetical protein
MIENSMSTNPVLDQKDLHSELNRICQKILNDSALSLAQEEGWPGYGMANLIAANVRSSEDLKAPIRQAVYSVAERTPKALITTVTKAIENAVCIAYGRELESDTKHTLSQGMRVFLEDVGHQLNLTQKALEEEFGDFARIF